MRLNIILECVETGERLYLTSKNKRNNPERLEMIKYSASYADAQFSVK